MARYKVSFYCDDLQVSALTSRFIHDVQGFTVVKVEEKPKGFIESLSPQQLKEAVAGFKENENIGDPTKFRLRQTHTPGGAKWSTKEPGKIVLRLFDELTIAHPVDICTALKKAGYAPNSYGAICAGLIEEGMLYRASRGAYRRPTALEAAQTT